MLSFTMWDEPAPVSLVASEDNVALSVIEGYYMRIACERDAGFEARFFNFLAAQVCWKVSLIDKLTRRITMGERLLYNY